MMRPEKLINLIVSNTTLSKTESIEELIRIEDSIRMREVLKGTHNAFYKSYFLSATASIINHYNKDDKKRGYYLL